MRDVLRIETLGGLSITLNGVPVAGFVSRKVEALLVYLARERREHPREMLAEFFWPEYPQSRAMGNLRSALSSLQGQLAPFLVVTRQTVAATPDRSLWLDASELHETLNATEERWRANGQLSRSEAGHLETAIALYNGDFLAGFHVRNSQDFEDWTLMEAEQLRQRVIEALYRLIEFSLDRRLYAAGIAHAQRLLELDPLLEDAHRQLMLLLARSGQRNAALEQYESYRRLLEKELGVPPIPEIELLHEQIQSGELSVTPRSAPPPNNLPVLATAFVNRPKELGLIMDGFDNPECRLLTLVGQGGIGKTRLAIEAASHYLEDSAQGVYFLDLSTVQSARDISLVLAVALNISTGSSHDPKNEIIGYLRDKDILLVMDNFEHVLDGASILSEILSRAPRVKILVTSRERLNLQEEWIFQINGLDIPAGDGPKAEDLDAYNSLQLFAQCASRARSDFSLPKEKDAVVQICRLVEGLPLGIELAAAWLRRMSCAQIVAQIEHNLDFLATSHSNIPERHRSVRALLDTSWAELNDAEQNTLMMLSVFPGSFDQQAAERVAGANLSILSTLVEKSLVRSEVSGRYSIHELLRRYAYEKIELLSKVDDVRAAHCDFFIDWLETLSGGEQTGPFIFDQFEAEYANIRSALEWASQAHRSASLARLCILLVDFWQTRGHNGEGQYWLTQSLSLMDQNMDDPLRLKVLVDSAILAFQQSDLETARQRLEEALGSPHLAADVFMACSAYLYLGRIALNTGEFDQARTFAQKVQLLARKNGIRWFEAIGMLDLGEIATEECQDDLAEKLFQDSFRLFKQLHRKDAMALVMADLGRLSTSDDARAKVYGKEALATARELKNKPATLYTLMHLGRIHHRLGEYPQAQGLYQESFQLCQELGCKLETLCLLEYIACLTIDDKHARQAVPLFGAASAWREVLGTPVPPRDRSWYDVKLEEARTALDEEDFATAWAEGSCLDWEQATKLPSL